MITLREARRAKSPTTVTSWRRARQPESDVESWDVADAPAEVIIEQGNRLRLITAGMATTIEEWLDVASQRPDVRAEDPELVRFHETVVDTVSRMEADQEISVLERALAERKDRKAARGASSASR